ncbi:hypothetical protein AVEN_176639-1 [Araneus ventricosus]|uniref:Uncharacterized protein n=1 Tax=Araneus ventricosus TaxID=182803 RepID=A0A4Y2R1F7_ARAVE|nr:hypothetical protein AVEN_176639-1 [Araneus ventricosus]
MDKVMAKVHISKRSHPHNVCSKKNNESGYLMEDFLSPTNERLKGCEVSEEVDSKIKHETRGKTLITMKNVNSHLRIHKNVKPFNFNVCGKQFPYRKRTIRNSFVKAEFFVSNDNSASTEDEDDIPLEELKKMWIQLREQEEVNDDVLIDDFLSLDSEAETSETLTELDILDSVKNKNNTAMNCDEENGNDHGAEINKPSYDEMLKSFKTIRRGLQFEENTPEGVFGALQRCETGYYVLGLQFYNSKQQISKKDHPDELPPCL